MKNRLFAALALAGIALVGSAAAAWGETVTFPIQVASIAIEGNKEISSRDVLKVVTLQVGDTLNAESDLKDSSQKIYDLGWFSEVLPDVNQSGEVTFHVVEYPAIEKIEITGNTHERDISVFGIKLFSVRVMPTWRIRQVLRDHNIKVGKTFRSSDLSSALQGVVDAYKERGYVLVMIGDVKTGSTLSIEVIEGHVASNEISGMSTIPMSVATSMIDLPTQGVLRQADLNTVVTRVRESVYFSDVAVTPSAGPTRDSVVLNWALTERTIISAPAQVRTIAIEGVTQFPSDVVTRQLGELPDGQVDNYAVLTALEGVFNLYTRAGFIMVRFSDPRIDGDVLRLRVDEGLVSEIALDQNTLTQQKVLEKMLQIRVGRILTRNDVRVSYQQLSALGYFDNINLSPEWTDGGVRVSVTLNDKTTLGGLNGSLAFEPTTGGIVGELTAKQRNILGTGQDVSLTYKRGMSPEGEPEQSTWELGYSTLATWSDFDRISVDLYRKSETTSSDSSESGTDGTYLTLGGNIQFSYSVADYTDFVVGYRHELEKKETEVTWEPIDALSLAIQEDSTDDPIFPMRGTRRLASLEKAGGFAVGKEYTKLDLMWTWFLPLYDDLLPGMDHALAIRLKAGLGDDGLVGTEAYQLGGATTIRGIDSTSVQRMAIVNVEHRLKLAEGFVLTEFIDAGLNLDSIRLDDALASTGIELGISAAGVYVRLDVSWSLGKDASWTPRFDFGFGPMF
jgi:outer membrane protein insertion porin family